MKQLLKYLMVALALGLALAACSDAGSAGDDAAVASDDGSGDSESSGDFGGDDEAMAEDDDGSSGDGAMADDDSGDEAAEPTAVESAASLNVGPESVDPTAKIIFEADATIEASDVAEASNRASEEAQKAGGYVSESDISLGETGLATMTLRVPAGQFDDLLDSISGIGTPISTNVSTDDVSLQYVDIVARINAQEQSLARVVGLLENATDTEAILGLERQIAQRQGDLDSLKGRKNFLDNRVSLSTIRLRIQQLVVAEEVVEPEVVEEEPLVEEDEPGFQDGLDGGVDAFMSVARVLAVVVGAILPFLPILLVGGLIYRIWQRSRDSRRFKATPTPPVDLGAAKATKPQPPTSTAKVDEEASAAKEPVGSGVGPKG